MNKLKFKLKGLHCQSCVKVSKSRIADIPGVKEVEIKDEQGEAKITSDRKISLEEIQEALEGTGYLVK